MAVGGGGWLSTNCRPAEPCSNLLDVDVLAVRISRTNGSLTRMNSSSSLRSESIIFFRRLADCEPAHTGPTCPVLSKPGRMHKRRPRPYFRPVGCAGRSAVTQCAGLCAAPSARAFMGVVERVGGVASVIPRSEGAVLLGPVHGGTGSSMQVRHTSEVANGPVVVRQLFHSICGCRFPIPVPRMRPRSCADEPRCLPSGA